ncbi:MAG: biotin/lipoyl-containing protein [Pseudomonadota bacterium]
MTTYTLTIDEQTFDVEIGSIQGDLAQVTVNQIPYYVKIGGSGQVTTQMMTPAAAPAAVAPAMAASSRAVAPKAGGSGTVTAPIPGKILTIMVKVGDTVKAGQVLAVIEAMKMENNIISPMDGTIKNISVAKDDDVGTGDVIMVVG